VSKVSIESLKMDTDTYRKMLLSLEAYRRTGGLQKLTTQELENIPKEVMIILAQDEIALVWEKLPEKLKNDSDMLKYQFCHEHSSSGDSDRDEGDGPLPRKLFCCYCKISDVTIKTLERRKQSRALEPLNRCNQQ
jgi:hypothetical protein